MEKVSLKEFKDRREEKNCLTSKTVTRQMLEKLKDDYTFNNWGVTALDLREYDFSKLKLEDMTKFVFSTSTIWPEVDKLPKGFSPKKILKDCATTSKAVKQLHKQGINGSDVCVAVIDSGFQADKHIEFCNAKLIKATNSPMELEYHHHMENVLAKLCGKNLGIAPNCKVFYYETSMEEDLSHETMLALKDVMKRVKNGEEIRVVSCSYSVLNESDKHYRDCQKLISQLSKLKCEVVDSSRFSQNFFCCSSSFLNQKDDFEKFECCSFVKGKPYEEDSKQNVNIVCSGKNVLEFCNNNGYKYEVIDCFSWTIPQCVGYYALCLQLNPNLTFDDFSKLCYETSFVTESNLRVLDAKNLILSFNKQISANKG